MKWKTNQRKRGRAGFKRGDSSTVKDDPFFSSEKKKRKMESSFDEVIDSDEDDVQSGDGVSGADGEEENGREVEETVDEKRHRVAKAYLDKLRNIAKRSEEEGEGSDEEGDRDYEKQGERDSLVASRLIKEQLEEAGRLRRELASRIQKPETSGTFRHLLKHRHPVTAVCLSYDDSKGFSASKDGTILQWDVNSGKGEKFQWPSEEILKSHGAKDPERRAKKRSKNVLALAVSPDGRYLATGGSDRHIHLWDTRTRGHIQAFPGHRGSVSCLAFREGTSELFSGSFDRSVKIWNVEDRAYMQTLFGHQSEILTIDCLRRERVLTVGRDRTMQLFKVPEESRLIFRASQSSLECSCFIDNDDFISGSDDGSIELWTMQKKKPISIFKNAHAKIIERNCLETRNDELTNGHLESCNSSSVHSWVSSVMVCRGSDLAASGAGNGFVRLWAIESIPKTVKPLFDISLDGFVNSLAFARSGKFLVAGVGKEPRLGRWGKSSSAENGVAIYQLNLL